MTNRRILIHNATRFPDPKCLLRSRKGNEYPDLEISASGHQAIFHDHKRRESEIKKNREKYKYQRASALTDFGI